MSSAVPQIVLASQSATRVAVLRGAGLDFRAVPADVDERGIEDRLVAVGTAPADIALALAEAKALAVAADHPDALVIGADQTLDAGGQRWHKAVSLEGARAQLLQLSGRTHHLRSAVVGVRGDDVRFRDVATAALTMRTFGPAEVDAYLAEVGAIACTSVGAYQIEGPGIRLFERIEGDHFTILGLPLLPLLDWLRAEGALAY